MTTLPGVRSRRHRLLVGGVWADAASGEMQRLTSRHREPIAPVTVWIDVR